MKKILYCLALFISFSFQVKKQEKPRVFVFTDINIDAGDPDDRQSLIHLFWYANELQIEGVVPDRWQAKGLEACKLVVDAYAVDYAQLKLKKQGYPSPASLDNLLATDKNDAINRFLKAAANASSPLYVLVWGNMQVFKEALLQKPEVAQNIRLLTIGTGLMPETSNGNFTESLPPCKKLNWNGDGRNEVFDDPRFKNMWWLEINFTYEGMFSGEEPKQMFQKLSRYGRMGQHLKEVVKNEAWAQYFRVGDTPSVLYVIDPQHNLDDPTQSSWAGKFVKPLPQERPNYYTDFNGAVAWNFANPCNTWPNHRHYLSTAKKTLE